MKKPVNPKQLSVKRETLRVLTPKELQIVAGGGARRSCYCN